MQVAFFCCFRQGVAGMSRDLGQDVLDLENFMQENFGLIFRFIVEAEKDVPKKWWGTSEILHIIEVARLQGELCTKYIDLSYEFSYEKCSEIFPEIFEPSFCGSESRKTPAKSPSKIPCEKSEKSPTNFCRSAGRTYHVADLSLIRINFC